MAEMNQLAESDPISVTGQKLQTRVFPRYSLHEPRVEITRNTHKNEEQIYHTLIRRSSQNVLMGVRFVGHSQRHYKLRN